MKIDGKNGIGLVQVLFFLSAIHRTHCTAHVTDMWWLSWSANPLLYLDVDLSSFHTFLQECCKLVRLEHKLLPSPIIDRYDSNAASLDPSGGLGGVD